MKCKRPNRDRHGSSFVHWVRAWKDHAHKHHEPESPLAHWENHAPFAEWPDAWRRKRGLLFLRFVLSFGLVALLMCGGVAGLAFMLSQWLGGNGQAAGLVWLAIIVLVLLVPLAVGSVALWTFRRIATPLSDVMQAADAVAEGNLNVRVPVPEQGPGEFRRLAQSFNRMTEGLQRSDRQRRNLTADVAHELRTPLHIIQGNLEGVLDGVYEPTEEHITATLNETQTLARLVNDLRTLSLAEAGELPMEWENVDITELLADVETSFVGQAEAVGVTLYVEAPGEPARLRVRGDVGRLGQVLSNLVANALRHTPSGREVVLRAELLDGGGVRITVRDTGEGIPAEDLPYVFDRFWRGDRSRSRKGGTGSGLGLAIARQLVQAHKGTIRVESEVGAGTVFVVELAG